MAKRVRHSDSHQIIPITREISYESFIDLDDTELTGFGTSPTSQSGAIWNNVVCGAATNNEGGYRTDNLFGGVDNFYHAYGRFQLPSGDNDPGEQILFFGFAPSTSFTTGLATDNTGEIATGKNFCGFSVNTDLDIVCHGIDTSVVSNQSVVQDQDFVMRVSVHVNESGQCQIGFTCDMEGGNDEQPLYRKGSVPAEQRIQFKDKTWPTAAQVLGLGVKNLDQDGDPCSVSFNWFAAAWNRK